jgi:hypothetical protein
VIGDLLEEITNTPKYKTRIKIDKRIND